MTPQTPLGWVGTGVMGLAMCGHLLARGLSVSIFTRTKKRAQPLLERGGRWQPSPREVAERSQVVCTMVGYPADVRAVYFGRDGVLAGAHPGTVLIDFTTTEPTLAREIASEAASRGVYALDAPVSGGDVGARNATLSIMVGGDRAAFEAMRPLMELVGKSIIHQGGPGAGQHAKMCNQIVIAGTMIGVCEALLYGRRAGLNLETMLQAIRGGAAGCWTLDNLAPRILKRNFDPGFFVEHFIKDMALALEEMSKST
jgi:3-hydroxyisobutyrate dehydrogenase